MYYSPKKSRFRFVFSLGIIACLMAFLVLFSSQNKYLSLLDRVKLWILPTQAEGVVELQLNNFRLSGEVVPILMYHGIVDKEDGVNIIWGGFIEHMQMLSSQGNRTLTTYDLRQFYQNMDDLPPKPIMITFDDGRKDSYYRADPILKKFNFRAVMFVTLNRVMNEDPFFLSWPELRRMHQSPYWDVQGHGFQAHDDIVIDPRGKSGHFISNKAWLEAEQRMETTDEYKARLRNDYQQTKLLLEENIPGIEVLAFAFPNSIYGQDINYRNITNSDLINLALIKEFFKLSFFQMETNFYNTRNNNPLLTKRLKVEPFWDAKDLLTKLRANHPLALPYEDSFGDSGRELHARWRNGWGEIEFTNNQMVVKNEPSTTGGQSFIKHIELPIDYRLETGLALRTGDSFSIFINYMDNQNYVRIGAYKDRYFLKQVVAGVQIMEWRIQPEKMIGDEFHIHTIELEGDQVRYKIDEVEIFNKSYIFNQVETKRRTVGFSVNDELSTLSRLEVEYVNIHEIK